MPDSIIFKGSQGLNNKIDPLRHPYNSETGIGSLVEAVNCDIDDSGMISRRSGQSEITTGITHSVFCDKLGCYFVQDRTSDAAIYQLLPDMINFTGIRSGLTKGAKVSFCDVGDRTYYANGNQNGYIKDGASNEWPDTSPHVGAETQREFYPAPVGSKIAYYLGCFWVAVDNIVYVSEPYSVGKFRLSGRRFHFGSNVRMIKPVLGGVWISDSTHVGFIPRANTFAEMSWVPKHSNPSHEWSENIQLVDLSNSAFQIQGLSAVWSSDAGLTIGTPDGQLINTTEQNLLYPTGSGGSTVVDGLNIINSIY